jgi:hypothetical protein
MLCLPGMQEQLHPLTGAVLFRGPRVKAGLYAGVPTRVGPHPTTGRADYYGGRGVVVVGGVVVVAVAEIGSEGRAREGASPGRRAGEGERRINEM